MLEIIVLVAGLWTMNPDFTDAAQNPLYEANKGPVISVPADTVTPQKPPKMN